MKTITIQQINAMVARHAASEDRRNAPKSVAMRAVCTLRSALADLSPEDRAEVLERARDEIPELAPCGFEAALVAEPQDATS